MIDFDNLNHHVWCYTHIINICSSHIISSMTSSKTYVSLHNVSHNLTTCNDSQDEQDDDDNNDDIDELELADYYIDRENLELKRWFEGIRHDSLQCTQRVIRLLRSSNQHREGFCVFICDGNKCNWFMRKDKNGKCILTKVSVLQPLRDVKTRWDLVYLMLWHLRELWLVCLSQWLDHRD
jgi:hypothetical protein